MVYKILSFLLLLTAFGGISCVSVSSQKNQTENLPKMENPHLLIAKSARTLELFDGDKLIKTYRVALGFAPEGDKQREGDGKTPEGEFYIFTKNAQSRFYLSLGLSYPAIKDAERGLKTKLITVKQRDAIVAAIGNQQKPLQNTKLGGEIYIHGGGADKDWTWGCAALADQDIKELFEILPVGTKVKIVR